jgi:putative endonuclease
MARKNEVGAWGEEVATEHLIKLGYGILERNWRMKPFEVDIIAMKGNRIVFVEVKTRTSSEVDPFETVDKKKMANLARSANAYVQKFDIPHEVQFDLIAVVGTREKYVIHHEPDSFGVPMRSY